MIIELQKGVYLAPSGKGCHAETFKVEYAKEFDTVVAAMAAVTEIRKYKLCKDAKIIEPGQAYRRNSCGN